VPSVRLKQEVAAVMNQYKGSSEEVRKISNELAKDNPEGGFIGRDGIPIKNLLLSIELAIESSSTGALEFKSFMDAFRSVNHDY